jgi:hypothetical protein
MPCRRVNFTAGNNADVLYFVQFTFHALCVFFVFVLFILVQVNGNWLLSKPLVEKARLTMTQIETVFGKESLQQNWFSCICATAIAVALLESLFPESEAEWYLLSAKQSGLL